MIMESFKDIINGDKPVLVDFYATWCGPCKAISPVIDSIASELKEKIRVLKIDIDKNQPVTSHYRVQGVPTFILFKKGKILWRNAGAMEKSTLLQQINYIINSK